MLSPRHQSRRIPPSQRSQNSVSMNAQVLNVNLEDLDLDGGELGGTIVWVPWEKHVVRTGLSMSTYGFIVRSHFPSLGLRFEVQCQEVRIMT